MKAYMVIAAIQFVMFLAMVFWMWYCNRQSEKCVRYVKYIIMLMEEFGDDNGQEDN